MMDITGPVAQVNTMATRTPSYPACTSPFLPGFCVSRFSGKFCGLRCAGSGNGVPPAVFHSWQTCRRPAGGRFSSSTKRDAFGTHTHAGPRRSTRTCLAFWQADRAGSNFPLESCRTRATCTMPALKADIRMPVRLREPPAAEPSSFDDAQTGAPALAGTASPGFPVHGTSLKVSNRYVSGDNKGIASQLMERHTSTAVGTGHLRAELEAPSWPPSRSGFPHSGDVSPNVR
uniref:Ceramidase_alk domain-containing protein n=1 Tax=Macrostomum lignano TaxID=282301 RepID=A0A1I8FK32_9PLAT